MTTRKPTPATAQRANNFHTLLAFFDDVTSTEDVSVLLDITHSAARKYMSDLVMAGIAMREPAQPKFAQTAKFTPTNDQAAIDAFLVLIQPNAPSFSEAAIKNIATPSGIKIHLTPDGLRDDAKPAKFKPSRDWAVAAIFGPARGAAC